MVLYQSRHDATEYGRLAQLVEHLLDVQEVTGSSPVPSTTKIPSQMTRDFLHGWDRTRTARPRRRRGKQQPSGLLFSARFPTRRNVYQESTTCQSIFSASASSNNRPIAKGRVSSWRCYPAFCALWLIGEQSLRMSVHGRYARTQEKEKVPAYRGVLSAGGMIYST